MLKALARQLCVAGVAAGLLVTCGVVPAQAAAAPRWRPFYLSRSTDLASIASTAPDAAWAVGTTVGKSERSSLLVWNGSRWRSAKVPGGSGFRPEDVQATAANDVWLMGYLPIGQAAYVWNGTSWRSVPLPDPMSATVLSSTDVWGSSGVACDGKVCTSDLWQYLDGAVETYTVPGTLQYMTGAGSRVWVLSQQASGRSAMYVSNSAGLQTMATPPGGRIGVDPQVAASPQGHVWLLAPSATASKPVHLDYWNGHTWTRRAVPGGLWFGSWSFVYDDHRGVWLGPYVHWTGRRWVVTDPAKPGPSYDLEYVAPIPGSASTWALAFPDVHIRGRTYHGMIALCGKRP
jgi:hypothetical protein